MTRSSLCFLHKTLPTMKSRLLGCVFLLFLGSSAVSGLGSVVSKYHLHHQRFKTWEDAQAFCSRRGEGNLATIDKNENIWDVLDYKAWIGLHRENNSDAWVWSDGNHSDFSSWIQNGSLSGRCAAIIYPNKKAYGTSCEEHFFFFCQKTDGSHRKYTFIPESKTWSDAREHCKTYNDLARFSNYDLETSVSQEDFPVWIGLHRNGGGWKWITGLSFDLNVDLILPESGGECVSMSSKTQDMATQRCNNRFTFICTYENVVLIKENKTWEEALERCRAHRSPNNNNLRFELLSVQPEDDHDYLQSKMQLADTEEVWISLRFLADQWLWVNGAHMQYTNLLKCPALRHHCGALSKRNPGILEAKDCLERKNFLCYSRN